MRLINNNIIYRISSVLCTNIAYVVKDWLVSRYSKVKQGLYLKNK